MNKHLKAVISFSGMNACRPPYSNDLLQDSVWTYRPEDLSHLVCNHPVQISTMLTQYNESALSCPDSVFRQLERSPWCWNCLNITVFIIYNLAQLACVFHRPTAYWTITHLMISRKVLDTGSKLAFAILTLQWTSFLYLFSSAGWIYFTRLTQIAVPENIWKTRETCNKCVSTVCQWFCFYFV